MQKSSASKISVIFLVIFISGLFFYMLRAFLMAIFLSGIFCAISYPLYLRFLKIFKGKEVFASLSSLATLLFGALLPTLLFMGVVTAQAYSLSQNVKPHIQNMIENPQGILIYLKKLPFWLSIEPHLQTILSHADKAVSSLSSFFMNSVTSLTLGTLNITFLFIVLLYTMFFFYIDGKKFLNAMLYYFPLENEKERKLLGHFTSVARATIKGSLIVGIIQGTLAGLAFLFLGIQGWAFWAMIMTVLSIIPGIGSALVWAPASIILLIQGAYLKGIFLFLFGAVIVGSVDNLLRPRLVGKDTKMHDLVIFFSTLGGIMMFGFFGFFIGPIVASLFVAIWKIFAVEFSDYLDTSFLENE